MNNRCIGVCDAIANTLEKIICMQKEAVREEIREEFCEISLEDGRECGFKCNTRPIQVFTDDDKAWSCPINRNEDGCTDRDHPRTCVFRAEKVLRDAVILRALVEERNEKHDERHNEECREEEFENNRRNRKERFKSTDSFITIKLANIAALRCLPDTFVDICIR